VLPELPAAHELFERLVAGDGILIERIVSTGQATPRGGWLEQDRDEWVVLVEGEAELAFEDGSRLPMRSGEYVLIPAGERHRVLRTRADPPCIWLAIHADFGGPR
jgi:cupin 2 domain-containing protein